MVMEGNSYTVFKKKVEVTCESEEWVGGAFKRRSGKKRKSKMKMQETFQCGTVFQGDKKPKGFKTRWHDLKQWAKKAYRKAKSRRKSETTEETAYTTTEKADKTHTDAIRHRNLENTEEQTSHSDCNQVVTQSSPTKKTWGTHSPLQTDSGANKSWCTETHSRQHQTMVKETHENANYQRQLCPASDDSNKEEHDIHDPHSDHSEDNNPKRTEEHLAVSQGEKDTDVEAANSFCRASSIDEGFNSSIEKPSRDTLERKGEGDITDMKNYLDMKQKSLSDTLERKGERDSNDFMTFIYMKQILPKQFSNTHEQFAEEENTDSKTFLERKEALLELFKGLRGVLNELIVNTQREISEKVSDELSCRSVSKDLQKRISDMLGMYEEREIADSKKYQQLTEVLGLSKGGRIDLTEEVRRMLKEMPEKDLQNRISDIILSYLLVQPQFYLVYGQSKEGQIDLAEEVLRMQKEMPEKDLQKRISDTIGICKEREMTDSKKYQQLTKVLLVYGQSKGGQRDLAEEVRMMIKETPEKDLQKRTSDTIGMCKEREMTDSKKYQQLTKVLLVYGQSKGGQSDLAEEVRMMIKETPEKAKHDSVIIKFATTGDIKLATERGDLEETERQLREKMQMFKKTEGAHLSKSFNELKNSLTNISKPIQQMQVGWLSCTFYGKYNKEAGMYQNPLPEVIIISPRSKNMVASSPKHSIDMIQFPENSLLKALVAEGMLVDDKNRLKRGIYIVTDEDFRNAATNSGERRLMIIMFHPGDCRLPVGIPVSSEEYLGRKAALFLIEETDRMRGVVQRQLNGEPP